MLEKDGVQVLGTPVQAIINTEDREIFADMLRSIDVKTPKSVAVNSIDEALEVVKEIGYPVIVRAAYTLGGLGSGFCNNDEQLREPIMYRILHTSHHREGKQCGGIGLLVGG